jgi:integrase
MTTIRLKYITADVDANANVRYYYRRPGQRKVRLRGIPGSETFMQAYSAALSGEVPNSEALKVTPATAGSFRAIMQTYFASAKFKSLDPATRAWHRRALEGVSHKHGDKPLAKLQTRHVQSLLDDKAEKSSVANKLRKALRAMFKWAIPRGYVSHNPVRDVELVSVPRSGGFHSWTLEEVRRFEDRHPVGTKARLAMAILLYTACRREDVVRLGRQHLRDGRLRFTQAKNEHRNPVEIDIPVHADLATIIEATPSGHLPFVVTHHGRPFSVAGFGNRFRKWCDEAGLPHCSAHGLRKAAAARLAERGATPHEIQAITGHKTLKEVERYTEAARRPGLADSAMAKLTD